MIKSFKSKALKLFWDDGDASKLPAAYIRKITMVLQKLALPRQYPTILRAKVRINIRYTRSKDL